MGTLRQFVFSFQALSSLVDLDLSYNKITTLKANLNVRLGNVKTLNLAGNKLESIEGTVHSLHPGVEVVCLLKCLVVVCLFVYRAGEVVLPRLVGPTAQQSKRGAFL